MDKVSSVSELKKYLYKTLHLQVSNGYFNCIEYGKEALVSLSNTAKYPKTDIKTRSLVVELNIEIRKQLNIILESLRPCTEELKVFESFVTTLPMESREVMNKRYICGMDWKTIVQTSSKGRSSVYKIHSECIEKYMEWRNKYIDDSNGTE